MTGNRQHRRTPAAAGRDTSSTWDESETDLPPGFAKPAGRALAAAGYVQLEQLAQASEAELRKLHGMGPQALVQLHRALAATGRTFADP